MEAMRLLLSPTSRTSSASADGSNCNAALAEHWAKEWENCNLVDVKFTGSSSAVDPVHRRPAQCNRVDECAAPTPCGDALTVRDTTVPAAGVKGAGFALPTGDAVGS